MTDAFAPRTGLAATTAYGQAYNSAASAAYMAKSATDIDATLDRLEQESPGDPEKFAAAVPRIRGRFAQERTARLPAASTTAHRGENGRTG